MTERNMNTMGVRPMDITIRADAKEIASLVLELQGKPGRKITGNEIRRILLEQLGEDVLRQQPAQS